MSRSYKTQPFFYMVCVSPKTVADYKRFANRMMRRTAKHMLRVGVEEELLPQKLDQAHDIWGGPTDGKKRWWDPNDPWVRKWLRKK